MIVDEEDKRSRKEIDKSRKTLEKLKVHPRDEQVNVAAMQRAERSYEGFTGPVREYIGRSLDNFKAALEKQDPRVIADARESLLRLIVPSRTPSRSGIARESDGSPVTKETKVSDQVRTLSDSVSMNSG